MNQVVASADDEKKVDPAKPDENKEEAPPVQPIEQQKRADEIRRARDSASRKATQNQAGHANQPAGADGQPGQPPAVQPPTGQPAQPTEPRPNTPRRSNPNRPATPTAEGAEVAVPAGEVGPSVEINIPATPTTDLRPPQDRRYKFAIKDGSYEQLLESVARQTGLGVLGDAPKDGKVSFVTDAELSFQEMLSKVRMLLFSYKLLEPYWLVYDGDHFEVKRVNDYIRILPEDRMFRSVDDFHAANLPQEELALVIYTPKGAISDLREVRNHLPDYVRVSPVEGRNSVAIFALVRDIQKYLRLVDFFAGEKIEVRTIRTFKVSFGTPSDLVAKLQTLLDFDKPRAAAGVVRAPRGGGQPEQLEILPEPETDIIADDTLRRILVFAMEDKIRQIEEMLPILDVAPDADAGDPVVIEVKNVDCTELTNTIQQVLTASPGAGAALIAPLPKRGKKAAAGGQPAAPSAPSAVKAEDVTLLPWPARNAIIVLADEEGVARVRRLAEMFDARGEVGPLRIALQHADAATAVADITTVMFGEAQPNQASPLHLVPDRSGTFLWFTGSEKQLAEVKELLSVIDVPEQQATLRWTILQCQKPSFVVTMLQALETGNAATAAAASPAPPTPAQPRKGGKRMAKPVDVSTRFTADDENRRLYIICTDDEWVRYQEYVAQLDKACAEKQDLYEILPLNFLTPDTAIERLNTLFHSDEMSLVRLAPTDNGVIVVNASPRLLAEMKSILKAIDGPLELTERTFEIRHVDPADMQSLLETMLGEEGSAVAQVPGAAKVKRKGGKAAAGAPPADENMAVVVPPTPVPTVSGPLTVARVANKLLVRTTPPMMERVVTLITEFDVEAGGSQLRVYSDFPQGADIDGIASTLSSVFVGSSPVPGAKGAKRGRTETEDGPQFIPQPGAGKLIVIAEATSLPKIEELLTVLRAAAGKEAEPIIVRFFELKHTDPVELAERLEPVLAMKVRRFQILGELGEPAMEAVPATGGKSRRAAPTQVQNDRYHIEPDPRNKRIVIAAPKVIIEEAAALIEQFDQAGLDPDRPVVRTVMLKNAESGEMVKAIQELIGSSPAAGRRPARAPKAAPAATAVPEEFAVLMSIAELPGGKGVVVRGMPEEVDQIVRHIEEIDNQSIAGRIVKVYRIDHTDIRKLADLILAVVDVPDKAGAGAGARKPPAGGRKGAKDEEDDEDNTFQLVSKREGQEVYVQTDVLAKTMIVAANQTKMAQVDKLVDQFNRAPEEGDEPATSPIIPKFTYDLKHKKAFDAKFDLELLLETVWEPRNELPDIDDSPVGEFLVVRYPYEDRFDEIRGYIRDYIDKPSLEESKTVSKVFVPPPGISPKDAAEWLKKHLPGSEIDIVIPPQPEQEEDFGIEEVQPPKQKQTQKKQDGSKVGMLLPIQRAVAIAMGPGFWQQPDEEQPEPEPEFQPVQIDPLISNMAMQVMDPKAGRKKDKDAKDEESDSAKKSLKGPTGPVRIIVDPQRGILTVEGAQSDVDDVKDGLTDLEEDIEDLPEKPDVRIIRVRHIDVDSAADILGDIFNSTRQQQAAMQQQMAAQARQQQMMQQAMQRGQQGQQGRGQPQDGQPGQPGGPNQPPGRGQPQMPQVQMPQMPLAPSQVTIVPNRRDRTLIIKASTSQYPEIKKLLATIDQPKPVDSEMKIFPLDKLNALEVEEILRDYLGIDQAASAGGGTRRAGAAAAAAAGGMGGGAAVQNLPTLPKPVYAATNTGTQPLTVDPKDIRITGNADTNSILVMGPKEAITFVGDLIRQLETQDIPERLTKHYALIHANAADVADYLQNQFAEARGAVRGTGAGGRARRGGGAGPDNAPAAANASNSGGTGNAPTFLAYTRLNMLTVQATRPQMDEIDAMIARLDVIAPDEKWESIKLAHADARVVADTLTAMFGGGGSSSRGGRSSGGSPAGQPSGGGLAQFIGDEGGRTLFYAAPTALKEQILFAIDQLETQSRDTGSVRYIDLVHAVASDVADAIDAAYGSRRGGGGGGGGAGLGGRGGRQSSGPSTASGARFTVSASDTAKKLFVVADDEMFGKIESLAKILDIPKKPDVQFKIYPMKFANAKAVHATMSKMVTDYLRMMPNKGSMEPFSAEVDERSNSIVVLGGPVVFGFVEAALGQVDTVANAASPPGFLMMVLKNADATEVAANITKLWGQKTPAAGEQPPQVEANRGTNVIFVRGTQAQIDEIKKQFIDPLESQTIAALKSETIKLEHNQAEVVAEALKRIFDEKKQAIQQAGPGRATPPLETAVAITPEVNTNTIVVQASDTNLAMIKAKIAELDKPEVAVQGATATRTYAIKFADPNTVANMIREWSKSRVVSAPSGKTPPRDQVLALAEPVTQSLVVTASEANHKLIEQILKDVDTDRAVGGEVRTIPILYGDATEIKTAVETMLAKPGAGGGRSGTLAGDVRVAVLTQSNAITISGDKDEVDSLEQTIKALDTAGEKGSVPQIIPLKHARAAHVLHTVQELFESPAGAGARRNRLPPTITVDEVTNSFVVRGGQMDVTAIKGLVAQLDTEASAATPPVKLIAVARGLSLNQLAADVEDAINSSAKAHGGPSKSGRPVPSVTVTPNTRTSTLMVSGSATLFDQVEYMVRELEKRGPAGGEAIRVLDLPNITPEEVEALMSQLRGDQPTGGRSGGARPSTPNRPSNTTRPRGTRP